MRDSIPIRHPVIWYVFAGSRGGYSRARIVRSLQDQPANTNQLAQTLALDYTTVQHHLKVLEQNGMIFGRGAKYGRTWFLTPKMEADLPAFASIWEKLDEKRVKSKGGTTQ